jgi:hypothetical protein
MKAETVEKIEQYLNDEMTPQERKDFERQLSTDDELRDEFNLYNSINNTMSATPNENELRQTLQQMNQKYFAEGTAVKKGAFNKWLSIAASVILITAISLYFILTSKPSTEKLYSDYAQHTPLNIQMRGTASDVIAQKAATAFNNKNYSTALPLLEMYLQQQPEDIQMKFAAAVCYLETENYTAGEKIFTSIANGQTAYAEAAKWYLALMALKQQDLVKCRRILSSISNTSLYFTKATALLEKLPD